MAEIPETNKDTKIIEGKFDNYKDWQQDPQGYFLIRVNKEIGCLELGFCKRDNVIDTLIRGKIPQELYFTAIKQGLVTRMEHAAYLGKELEKAHLALKYNLEYVQDEELCFDY